MNHRTLPDPHDQHYYWRVVNGERQYCTIACGMWWTRKSDLVFDPTPARCAVWADLMLQPFDD